MVDLLVFDLDGTLIDSKLDIALSVNATRAHMALGPLDIGMVSAYVGNGAPVLIRRAIGNQATKAEFEQALEFFLSYYREHALDCTTLYPGVKESLDHLRAAGKHLAVLTNKPVDVSRSIVEGLGVAPHFFRVYGGDSFDFKKPHPAGIQTLMAESGVARDCVLMVGDTSVDVQTARNAGVRSCGVTYGFAPETLRDPAPDLLIDRMPDLAHWVLAGVAPRK